MDQAHSTQHETSEVYSLGEKLKVVIEKLPPGGVTITETLNLVGNDSLLFLTIFLSLVFLVPVSIPGVSTVFGLTILLIGITRLFGRNLWTPTFIANRIVSTDKLCVALNRALVWFHRLERVSRPHRLNWLASSGVIAFMNNCALILAALLLMAPFGMIPFSNTLPALALIFLSIGLLQRDGICILLGYVTIVATILYFAFLIALGGLSIHELFQRVSG